MAAPSSLPPQRFGRAVLDLDRRELSVGGTLTHLRVKSFDVLAYLVQHPGRVVPKQELIDEVWQGAAVTDDSLVQCLMEIRRALGADDAHIQTIRGVGYRFDSVVRAAIPESSSRPEPPPAARVPAPRPRLTGGRWLALGATVVALALLAWQGTRPAAPGGEVVARAAAQSRLAPQVTLQAGVAQLMVTGNAHLASRSIEGLHRAREAFTQAMEQDPRYAPAQAALSNVLTILFALGAEPGAAVLPKAVELADQAVELDPTYALGWHALAHAEVHWTRDWNRAELHYRRAIALDPRAEMPAYRFAHLLMGLGRGDEAIAQSLDALALNPKSAVLQTSTGIVHRFVKGPEASLPYFEQARALDSTYSIAPFWGALSLADLGRFDQAMEWALAARDRMGNTPTWVVGYVHARAGRRLEAEDVLTAMGAHARSHYVSPMEFAYLHLALGDRDRALTFLETSVREHARWVELMAVDPILAPLRSDPRYAAALAAMKLAPRR